MSINPRSEAFSRRTFLKSAATVIGAVAIPTRDIQAEPPLTGALQGVTPEALAQPLGEGLTRVPIPYVNNGYNWFATMFEPAAQAFFAANLQALRANPPHLMTGGGGQFVGSVPFDWGYRGAIQGNTNPLLGDWTQHPAPPCAGYQRLSPSALQERLRKLTQYLDTLHRRAGLQRVMPYMDFGTQLFGRHTRPTHLDDPCHLDPDTPGSALCPAQVPPSVWGFWEFYDHWEAYAQPTGPFDLGPKPPGPTTWLRKWYDPQAKQSEPLPDELQGLSFAYGPIKCNLYGPHYRYAVCVNTPGWHLWWKQVIRWVAQVGYDGAFIDNATFTNCWNDECQQGYSQWLAARFTPDEIRRYFTTPVENLLADPSLELPWFQETPGQWRSAYWSPYPAARSPLFPDTDAYGGKYACRIEAPGGDDPAYLSHATQSVPLDQDLRLTFYYKTEGFVQTKLVIQWVDSAQPFPPQEHTLAARAQWTQAHVDFHTPQDVAHLYLRFEVTGTGTVWVDEFWLGAQGQAPVLQTALEPPGGDPLRLWAAGQYWSHVADERLGYLRREARRVNPRFELLTNGFHAVHVDYFLTEKGAFVGELDAYRRQYRQDYGYAPGIHLTPTPVVITNIFGYKYVHARRQPDWFAYHMPQLLTPDEYAHNPDSALLNLAEAAAFGGGAGCDPANLHQEYYRYDDQEKAAIRTVEQSFWRFINLYPALYAGYRTFADIGLVFHDLPYEAPSYGREEFLRLTDLARGLEEAGTLWNVLPEHQCSLEGFNRLRVLVYQDVERISAAEAEAVLAYIKAGGLVMAAGIVGDVDEWFRSRLSGLTQDWPPVGAPPTQAAGRGRARPGPLRRRIGQGTLLYQPQPFTAAQVIAAAEAHLGRSVRVFEGTDNPLQRLRVNAWLGQTAQPALTVHVVNYNVPLGKHNGGQVPPVHALRVAIPLPECTRARRAWLYTPGVADRPVSVPVSLDNGVATFDIPHLHIYGVAHLRLTRTC